MPERFESEGRHRQLHPIIQWRAATLIARRAHAGYRILHFSCRRSGLTLQSHPLSRGRSAVQITEATSMASGLARIVATNAKLFMASSLYPGCKEGTLRLRTAASLYDTFALDVGTEKGADACRNRHRTSPPKSNPHGGFQHRRTAGFRSHDAEKCQEEQ